MASLQKIKQLKQHKLESAETALRIAIHELKETKEKLQKAKELSARFIVWRKQEEQRMFARIENQLLRTNQLDHVRERIASLHENEAKKKQTVLELENAVEKAIEHKNLCQQMVRKAEKDLEKYNLLIQETLEEAKIMQERQSEDLLDEFASIMTEKNIHANH